MTYYSHKGTMGRVTIVPKVDPYIILTPQVTYYRVKDEKKVNKEFLYCLFMSERFQKVLSEESDQSTRQFISILNQRLIKLVLPSIDIMSKVKKVVEPIVILKSNVAGQTNKLELFQR